MLLITQKWFIKFLKSATTVKRFHLNNKSDLDREDKFSFYIPWGFWSRRWPLRWFVGRASEPLQNLLGLPAPHSVLRGTPRQNEPGMNRGAQTWDCGELGRKGKRQEELKDGKKGEQYTAHKHKQSQRGWEEWKMFPFIKPCLYTESGSRPGSTQTVCTAGQMIRKQVSSFAWNTKLTESNCFHFFLWFIYLRYQNTV